jgi:nucleoside phosphorylase/tetratricopeptide (TPR) repeat protein
VLIVTAAEGEDDAVRALDEGGLGVWEETPGPPGFGFAVWRRWYQTADGTGRLSVALCRAYEMGGESTANAAARLVDAYQPRCLAMCGVCAGDPQKTCLGDVIVADRVYRYDVGETVQLPGAPQPEFRADTMTFPFRATWKQAAENLASTWPVSAAWLADRPRPRVMQADWVLNELLDGRNPLDSPDRASQCADWTEVVGQLQRDKLIRVEGGQPQLTTRGRERIQQTLFDYGGELPTQTAWAIHVGPLGTGNNLVRDARIWERLSRTQRHILGLDMEGSVIGFTAHVQNVESFLVAKGVMDYAEPGRGQGFRTFAARAAAEVLLGFLRRHLPPLPRRTAAEILRSNTTELPEAASPATLLNARYQVVPFFDALRRHELDMLDAWCHADDAADMRLLVGPGGSGKTRLMIHWSTLLRQAQPAWQAGFLPDRVTAEDLDALLAGDRPTLIVVDYAETRRGVFELLQRLADRPGAGRPPCRVVLLARDVGDWWRALRQQEPEVVDLLDRHQPMRLQPVPVEGELRQQAFEQALESFAAVPHRLSEPDDNTSLAHRQRAAVRTNEYPPDLSDDHYSRVLYLHIAALAAVEGLSAPTDQLLAEILDHEARFWRWQYPRQFPDDPLDHAEFVAGLQRMVAGVTLLGGVASRDAVEALRDRVQGPDLPNLARFLHWLYPGASEAAWIGALEPDLLGEALVARVLADRNTPQDYLEQVVADGGAPGLGNSFVVLGRIALWDAPHGTAWLARLLAADVSSRARVAFDAALTLGGQTALAPLGQVLADALARSGTTKLAAELESQIPWETVSLREVGLWAVCTLLDRPLPSAEHEAAIHERAQLLHNAGKRFSDLGRREEALQATVEAVEIRRRLAAQRPEAFLPDLAQSLNNLGIRLSNVGRHEEALQATVEAVEIRRRLAVLCPDAFLSDLAGSLYNLGIMLSSLGRR